MCTLQSPLYNNLKGWWA